MGGGIDETVPGFLGWLDTPAGRVARIGSDWTDADRFGAMKVRWAIGRMEYLVPPGLYAIGNPSDGSAVVVTANYKLTFDLVRRALSNRDAWLLVLETHGINVWCAGGKGTFGTAELCRRIESTNIARVVRHRVLLLPILSANGVRAVDVKARTGFEARFAAIRAEDLPELLDNGWKSTESMRAMTFTLRERAELVPVEVVLALRGAWAVFALLLVAGGIAAGPAFPLLRAFTPALLFLAGMLTGAVGVPLLLPLLPPRAFSAKGALLAGVPAAVAWAAGGMGTGTSLAALLAVPAVSGYYALKFTGSTPFTSKSGVKKELRRSLPLLGLAATAGAVVWLVANFGGGG